MKVLDLKTLKQIGWFLFYAAGTIGWVDLITNLFTNGEKKLVPMLLHFYFG